MWDPPTVLYRLSTTKGCFPNVDMWNTMMNSSDIKGVSFYQDNQLNKQATWYSS